MNKDFMSEIFDKLYTDPIYEIVASKNTEYKTNASLLYQMQKFRNYTENYLISSASKPTL